MVISMMMKKCLNCNEEISSLPKSKPKKYCNDKCRLSYWSKNSDKLKKRAFYQIKCKYCGKKFSSYGNKSQKYCNLECYKTDRWQKEYQIKYQANIFDKKSEALKLRDEYFSYGKIAKFLGLSRNTIKTWCRRSGKSISKFPVIKSLEEFQKRLELMSENADLNKN